MTGRGTLLHRGGHTVPTADAASLYPEAPDLRSLAMNSRVSNRTVVVPRWGGGAQAPANRG